MGCKKSISENMDKLTTCYEKRLYKETSQINFC